MITTVTLSSLRDTVAASPSILMFSAFTVSLSRALLNTTVTSLRLSAVMLTTSGFTGLASTRPASTASASLTKPASMSDWINFLPSAFTPFLQAPNRTPATSSRIRVSFAWSSKAWFRVITPAFTASATTTSVPKL